MHHGLNCGQSCSQVNSSPKTAVMALQVYGVRDSLLCLTGTAEVPLGAYHMDQILGQTQLPIKMAAFGHCFRTEAGAGGEAINYHSPAPSPMGWFV